MSIVGIEAIEVPIITNTIIMPSLNSHLDNGLKIIYIYLVEKKLKLLKF